MSHNGLVKRKRLLPSIAVLLTALPLLVASPVVATTALTSPVTTLVTDGFQAGNIISDAVFTNEDTMSEAQIQTFFNSKVSTCRGGTDEDGRPIVCLKNFKIDSVNRSADSYCKGYSGARGESAARIIYRVAQSCNINPQVLIVMLQKEQSLVTHTWPSAWRYDIALGQGCPDDAPCDPQYVGFFHQVYGAARQMQIYLEGRHFTWYAPGNTWNILYHPTRACGTSPVYIANKATAALYYYTPYQPNAAALRAGYGAGDSCSSYGNRNFHNYFKDWFGSATGFPVTGAIRDAWVASGGESGWVGPPTAGMRGWDGAGWSQRFANADIFVRAGHSATVISGAMRTEYRLVGEVRSGLGWPVTSRVSIKDGAYTDFTGGRIYERLNAGAFAVAEPMFTHHEQNGNVFGSYGWPTNRAHGVPGGSAQGFDNGTFYQSTNGVVAIDSVWSTWLSDAGGTGGEYGIPVAPEADAGSGQTRLLLSKAVAYRNGENVVAVTAPILDPYARQHYEAGALGRPTAQASALPGGRSQPFDNGEIYSSKHGTFVVSSFAEALKAGGGTASLGYPTAEAVQRGTARSQPFVDATLTHGDAGDQVVVGAIKRAYDNAGGATSMLGAARSAERAERDGYVQDFDGARLVCTPTVVTPVPLPLVTAWDSSGGSAGRLGWPTSSARTVGGVTEQNFIGGVIAAGSDGDAFPIVGLVLRTFRVAGGSAVLGAPLGKETESADGFSQRFEHGTVFVPRAGVASAVAGSEFHEFQRVGGETVLGFPTGPATKRGVGTVQPFRAGEIATIGNKSHTIRGTTAVVFRRAGGYEGALGYPTGNEVAVRDGYVQQFQGGSTYVTPVSLAVTRGVLHREYTKNGGPNGALGWPLGDETSGAGTWEQRFQHGAITLYSDGRVVVG